MEETKLLMRSDVPVNETWDLSLLYETPEAFEADLTYIQTVCDRLKSDCPGTLTTPEAIAACLNDYMDLYEHMVVAGNYADLAVEVDYYNNEAQELSSRTGNLLAAVESDLSFIESEISQQPEAVLKSAGELIPACRGYLNELIRKKPHLLHPEAERVLAAIAPTAQAPYTLYNTMKLADMKFDSFEADGKTWPLGYSLFEDKYEYEPNTAVRRAAFDAFYQKLGQYENATAAAFNAHLQHQKILAGLRGFASMEAQDLFQDHVTPELYNRQIDLITTRLAPHMQKYARLIQRIHGLDRMTYADLKLPVDPDYTPEVTIAGSRQYIEKGLALMGEDYVDMIRTAYEQRWVDFAQNQGKCTGGFCSSPYGKNSFILMSWQGKMSDVFTLAHELGHAGHFKRCNEAQSIFDTSVSGYFVEAPSTMNEILMAHYLLKTSDDLRFRRWVLSNMISNTYYHNFVTHLLEGAYQREVYRIVDAGGSVQAETLSGIFKDVLSKFWGDAVELVPGSELTWMRQPHYYMGLYSYSYSAGLTVATQMCKRIEAEGAPAVEDWKKVLSAGSTLDPIGLAALGGIDITTDAALLDTIAIIGGYIDEICRLTEVLEG